MKKFDFVEDLESLKKSNPIFARLVESLSDMALISEDKIDKLELQNNLLISILIKKDILSIPEVAEFLNFN